MTQKTSLRSHFTSLRDALPLSRRKEASKALFEKLKEIDAKKILSFVAFRSEIDLAHLNQLYASQGRLALPRYNGIELELFDIDDFGSLKSGSLGILEPDSTIAAKLDLLTVDLILVPGLAFDSEHYRLGYGMGLYDQLLKLTSARTIGVGFQEQKSLIPLPRDSWDLPVRELLLF